jgi:hypothetical protein
MVPITLPSVQTLTLNSVTTSNLVIDSVADLQALAATAISTSVNGGNLTLELGANQTLTLAEFGDLVF